MTATVSCERRKATACARAVTAVLSFVWPFVALLHGQANPNQGPSVTLTQTSYIGQPSGFDIYIDNVSNTQYGDWIYVYRGNVSWSTSWPSAPPSGSLSQIATGGYDEENNPSTVSWSDPRGVNGDRTFTVLVWRSTGSWAYGYSKAVITIADIPNPGGGPDTSPPTVPSGLGASPTSPTSLLLSWSPSSDNVAVVAYELFRDGTSVGQTSGTSFHLTGLPIATAYNFAVRAVDSAGNWSPQSAALVVHTPYSVAAGATHSLAAKTDGTVCAWGGNPYGQLGNGTIVSRATPTSVSGLTNVMMVAAGDDHSLALKRDGTVWAWGRNNCGQLGDGTTSTRTTPVQVSGLNGIIAIAAGSSHSMALRSDGMVLTWGSNACGQQGIASGYPAYRTTAAAFNFTGVVGIAAAGNLSVAVKSNGTVWEWGHQQYDVWDDQSSQWTPRDRFSPEQVGGLSNAVSVAAGVNYRTALTSDGIVWAWGYRAAEYVQSMTPVQVPGLAGIAVVAGGRFAMSNTGTAWQWDMNNTVTGFGGYGAFASIAAGPTHQVVVQADGTLRSWGANGSGQLGDGTFTARSNPVAVLVPDNTAPSAPTNLQAVAANVNDDSVPLTWSAATDNIGVAGYEVFCNGNSCGVATGTSFTVSNLSAATTYQFTVRARDASNNWSAQSIAILVETTGTPPAPAADYDVTVTGSTGSYVWGSGPYTDDSNIAAAAVHAGLIPAGQTAVVHVHYLPGQSSYMGSVQHGVTTLSCGAWGRSISLSLVGTGSGAPVIFTAPVSETVAQGEAAVFSVAVSGAAPMSCQWKRNGMPVTDGGKLSGATTSTLTIADVSSADEGSYSVTISNTAGSVTSNAAPLIVDSPPAAQGATANAVSPTEVTMTATATDADPDAAKKLAVLRFFVSAPPAYNGYLLIGEAAISGNSATGSFTWRPAAPLASGVYYVWVRAFDQKGEIDSNGGAFATFTVGSASGVSVYLSPTEIASGQAVSASYAGAPNASSWLGFYNYSGGDGAPVLQQTIGAGSGSTTFATSGVIVGQVYNARLFGSTGTTNRLATSNSIVVVERWGVTVVNGTGGGAYAPPGSVFSINANAPAPGDVFSGWTFVGNANGATLTAAAQGSTTVTLGHGNATVMANYAPLPPTLTVQPTTQMSVVGETVVLSVTATGNALSYQWRRNGTPLANGPQASGATISGATTASLTITNAQLADAAAYTVVVTNAGGSITSAGAILGIGGIDLLIHRP